MCALLLYPVSVFIPPDGEVSAENPGTLRLRLRPSGRSLQVLDHQERNEGVIRSEGLVRRVRYVMRRDENPVWILSIRSVVRKRHRLHITDGETWTFDTPFYWWQHLNGSLAGAPRLMGHVGHRSESGSLASNQVAKPTMSWPL